MVSLHTRSFIVCSSFLSGPELTSLYGGRSVAPEGGTRSVRLHVVPIFAAGNHPSTA